MLRPRIASATSLKQGQAALFLGSAQGAAVATAVVIHLTALRSLAPADYAWFGLLMVASTAMQSVLAGGIPNALRRAAGARSSGFAIALRPAITVHLVVCGAVFLGVVLVACAVGLLTADGSAAAMLAVGGMQLFACAGLFIPAVYILNGRGRYGTQAALKLGHQIGRLILLVPLLMGGAGPVAGMAGLAVAALVSAWAGYWLVQPQQPEPPSDSGPVWATVSRWLRLGGWHDGLLFVIPVANLCSAKAMAGHPAVASVYVACFALAQATAALGIVFAGIFFAPTAQAYARGDGPSVRSSLATAIQVQALLLMPIIAFVPLRGPQFLQWIMNSGHQPSGILLGLLLASGALLTLWKFVGEMLAAAGHLRGRLILAAALAAAGVPMMLALTSIGQSEGAALSLLLTALGGVVGSIILARSMFGPFMPWSNLCCVILAAAVAAFCIAPTAFPPGILWSGIDGVLRCSIYALLLACLWAVKQRGNSGERADLDSRVPR